jgi:hypothetical protein
MKIIEQNGNILDVMKDHFIAHAISGDFTLGAGVAKIINENFGATQTDSCYDNLVEALNDNYEASDNFTVSNAGETFLIEKVFNIVVKDFWRDRINENNLFLALMDLRRQCEDKNIDTLYMPKICCGREKMDWNKVKGLIENAFNGYDIVIIVLTFNEQKKGYEGVSNKRKLILYNEMLNYISEIIDDDKDLYKTLLHIGFTQEEIEYEGFDLSSETECNCDGDCDEDCDGDCDSCSWKCDGPDINGYE